MKHITDRFFSGFIFPLFYLSLVIEEAVAVFDYSTGDLPEIISVFNP